MLTPDVLDFNDPNIPRWLMASCRVHFDTRNADEPIFWEHLANRVLVHPTTKVPYKSYVEFRMNGPYVRKITASEAWYDIDINVLCSTFQSDRSADNIERLIGTYYEIFTNTIEARRYGSTNPPDDKSYIGCLRRLPQREGDLKISRFGQANPDTKFIQATVEGQYRMKLFKREDNG